MIITFVVFLIAGFWHGPSWNYVIFGAFTGYLLLIIFIKNISILIYQNIFFGF